MRTQVVLGAVTGGLLLGFLVYCSPSAQVVDDSDAAPPVVCDDSGANCACDPGKFKVPVDCYTGPKGTSGKGACKTGKRSCGGSGMTSDCIGQVTPTAEVCDYLDNDCNGVVDDVPGSSALSEDAGGATVLDLCQSPSCDPTYSDAGIGCYNGTERNVCKAGKKVCGPGRQLTCQPFNGVIPQMETCNGWDDDCNDMVDDGLDNLGACDVDLDAGFTGADGGKIVGECLKGTGHCADGGQYCPPADPVAEKCDGKDNDCNNKIDDKSCPNQYSNYCCHIGSSYTCAPSYYTQYGYTCIFGQ